MAGSTLPAEVEKERSAGDRAEDDRDWELGRDEDLDDLETGTLAADGT